MGKNINGKLFVKKIIISLTVMLITTSVIGYILDPAMYYRISSNKTYCTEHYTTAGLLKNSEAEIAIVGSSMMQNTNVNFIEKLFDKKAVKYTMSGMTIDEVIMLVDRAISLNNNVNTFIINLDISMFNSVYKSPGEKFPQYIYDENKINDIKYLLGYDTWFKFIPFNIFYNLACKIEHPIAQKIEEVFKDATDFNVMANWSDNAIFSENIVKSNYKNGVAAISKQNLDGMLERMKNRFDEQFYHLFKSNPQKQFKFIFPPYSSLMWYDAEQKGYIDILLNFKKYIVKRFNELDNVTLYDFQDYEKTIDLNNYKDSTHYTHEFNNMMIESIANEDNIINISNVDERIGNIKRLLSEFKLIQKEWIVEK